ncbi:MAG TPA: DUF2167 domain-containing protein [Verrucomicrobiae bacterium]
MKALARWLVVVACGMALIPTVPAQEPGTNSGRKLSVVKGPAQARLGSHAQIDLPSGYVFLDGAEYRRLLKAEGEPVSGDEVGWLKPTNQEWAVVFHFSGIGYVKDDDKDKLDADKLLDSIRRGTAEANKVRAKAGHPPIEVIGWDVRPKYDETTHNLEWAVRGQCEGQPILNYNTRLLGRKGVMGAVLIVEPDKLNEALPTVRELLTGYRYTTGESYAEYKPGDKVAKYGLGALVVGGAAVGAAKLGMFAWLAVFFKKAYKLIVVALVAAAAFLKKLFTRQGTRTE